MTLKDRVIADRDYDSFQGVTAVEGTHLVIATALKQSTTDAGRGQGACVVLVFNGSLNRPG